MNFPNCSRCGKPYNQKKEFENWSVTTFKKPELSYIPDPDHTIHYVFCSDCATILANSWVGYKKKKETTWSQA